MSQQARSSRPADLRRRGFLLTVGTGGVATAATAVAALAPAASTAAEALEPQQASEGYRETRHVRDYYRTTKI